MKARKNCKGRGEGCRGRWGSYLWPGTMQTGRRTMKATVGLLLFLPYSELRSPFPPSSLSLRLSKSKYIINWFNQLIYNAHKGFGKVTFSLLWADSNLLIATAVLQRHAHLSCSSCGVVAHHQFAWKWKALAEVWNSHTCLHPQPQMTELTSGWYHVFILASHADLIPTLGDSNMTHGMFHSSLIFHRIKQNGCQNIFIFCCRADYAKEEQTVSKSLYLQVWAPGVQSRACCASPFSPRCSSPLSAHHHRRHRLTVPP